MFKRLSIAAVLLASLSGIVPASAGKALVRRSVTFSADPCHVVCPWWVDTGSSVPGDPATFDPLTHPLPVLDSEIESGCTSPGPAGSYDDLTVRAPKSARWLIFEAWPSVDWDIFVCMAARGPGDRYVAHGANSAADIDPNDPPSDTELACSLGVGCAESATARIRGGARYILRAYNWSDPDDLPARYTFTR